MQSNMATVLINDPIRVPVCLPPYNVLPTGACIIIMVVQYREFSGPIYGGAFLYWTVAGFFILFFSYALGRMTVISCFNVDKVQLLYLTKKNDF